MIFSSHINMTTQETRIAENLKINIDDPIKIEIPEEKEAKSLKNNGTEGNY